MTVNELIEHLVAVQAQAPLAPYVTLWTRLNTFDPVDLATLLLDRDAVRMTAMRATIHLVTARDALHLRPWLADMVRRRFASSAWAKESAGVDLDALYAAGIELVEAEPRSRTELMATLATRWPEWPPAALAQMVTSGVAPVQVTPRGVWGRSGAPRWTTVESWLGRDLDEPQPAATIRRYLAAYGPASVMDAQAWSGLTRLAEIFEGLRPELVTFRSEAGRELFDLPEAPRPDPETPALPRFLGEFDNVLIAHADRSRAMDSGRELRIPAGNGATTGSVLIDGFFRAEWQVRKDVARSTIVITPYVKLTAADRSALSTEALRLLALLDPNAASTDVEFAAVP